MLIECPYCESKVDAKVLADVSEVGKNVGVPISTSFVQCPRCNELMVSYQELERSYENGEEEWDYGDAIRLWPKADKSLHHSIPQLVRDSIEEAEKCYRAKAYHACAVMCGRAIESICEDHKVSSKTFGGGLKELLDKGVIDKKLFSWSEALRRHRNIGAHANFDEISKEDARDLIDFANAISDYIYVLTSRFDDFMSRVDKKISKH